MKKILLNSLYGFVLGAVIFTGVGVYAVNTIFAQDISYKDTTVEMALNDLYSKKEVELSIIGSSLENSGVFTTSLLFRLPDNNNVKKVKVKDIEYLNSTIYSNGDTNSVTIDGVKTSTPIAVNDEFEINGKSFALNYYGNTTEAYGNIQMVLLLEYK